MLIISQNATDYDLDFPKDAVLRINLAWCNSIEELESILKKKEKISNSQKFDVFIFGHSHTKHHEIVQNKKRETIILNPGSSHSQALTNFSDPPYFPAPSIVIFDTNTKESIFVDL